MSDSRTIDRPDNEGGQLFTYESDLHLIERARDGDASSVDELLERLRLVPRILRAQSARLGSPLNTHELDDLAQDVFVVIWRKLESYDGQRPFEAWAYRICRYELMNAIRRRGRNTMAEVHPDVPERARPPAPPIYEELHRGLETLPASEASVVQLKHFEDLTFDEIGGRLSISSNTAKTRYYRAVSRLGDFLRDHRALERGAGADGPVLRGRGVQS